MTVKLLFDTLQILTSCFLIFAAACFLHGAFENSQDNGKLFANVVSAVFMILAALFTWR